MVLKRIFPKRGHPDQAAADQGDRTTPLLQGFYFSEGVVGARYQAKRHGCILNLQLLVLGVELLAVAPVIHDDDPAIVCVREGGRDKETTGKRCLFTRLQDCKT